MARRNLCASLSWIEVERTRWTAQRGVYADATPRCHLPCGFQDPRINAVRLTQLHPLEVRVYDPPKDAPVTMGKLRSLLSSLETDA